MSSEWLPRVPMTPIRHYQQRETGRGVLLVAAAHIAAQSYYDTLQLALIEFEEAGGVPLFRSYKPRMGWIWSCTADSGNVYAESWQQRDAHEVDFIRRVGSLAILSEGVRTFLTNQIIGCFSPSLKRELYVESMPGALEYAAGNGTRKHGRENAATINYRNGVALAAFDEQVTCEPARSVALLWGYGHFAGLADGLEARGYDEWVPLFDCDHIE